MSTGGPRGDGRTVVCVVGTRPEAIKMAPVIRALRASSGFWVRLVVSGQHRELLDQALADFGLVPDVRLDLMRPGQSLADLTAGVLAGLSRVIAAEYPDLVLAQGDTTTVLAASLASFYQRVPFGHVEAGLRTGDLGRPFPEEMNRVLATRLARLHFAPTDRARRNLLAEGVDPATIVVTGNPAIDALGLVEPRPIGLPASFRGCRILLVTAHRRESFGPPLAAIARGLRDLVERHDDLAVVWPVHPNPAVRPVVAAELRGAPRVHLTDPVGYREFVTLMRGAFAILTDSGGVQEEAPSLGRPVLVLRDETERPEAVEAGTARLVGPRRAAIVAGVETLLDHPDEVARIARLPNPFGDGRAAERIVAAIRSFLAMAGES